MTVLKEQLSCSGSTIEGNFFQNDYHFRGRGKNKLYILYNLFQSFLSLPLSNSLLILGQPYSNTYAISQHCVFAR